MKYTYNDEVKNDFAINNANSETIRREYWQKEKNDYIVTYVNFDACEVYKQLSNDLTAKYINHCTYIRSIKRVNNYNGTIAIYVSYTDNKNKSVYIVSNC